MTWNGWQSYTFLFLILGQKMLDIHLAACTSSNETGNIQNMTTEIIDFFNTYNWTHIALISPNKEYKILLRKLSQAYKMATIYRNIKELYALHDSDLSSLQGKIVVWCNILCQEDIVKWATIKNLFVNRYTWLFVEENYFYNEGFVKIKNISYSLRPDSSVYILSMSYDRKETAVEVYRLRHDGPKKVQLILIAFNRQNQWENIRIADSPMPLKGFTLKIGIGHFPPIGMLSTSGNVTSFKGQAATLIELIAKYLGFRCEYIIEETRSYGVKQRNGSWSGLMGMLQRKEIDLSGIRLSAATSRLSVADYTAFVVRIGSVAVTRKPTQSSTEFDVRTYTKPFPLSVWVASSVVFMLAFISFMMTFQLGKAFRHLTLQYLLKDVGEKWWLTIYLSIQVGVNRLPTNVSSYVTAMCFVLFVLVVGRTYNSFLMAALTVKKSYNFYNTIDELIDDGKYSIIILKSTSEIMPLKVAESGKLARIWAKISENPKNFVSSSEEGIKKISKEKSVFIMSESYAEKVLHSDCSLTYINDKILHRTVHLAIQKNSPFKEAVSSKLMAIRSAGLLTPKKPLEPKTDVDCRHDEDVIMTVGIKQALTCFLFLICGYGLAILALCTENVYERYKKCK